MQRRQFLLWGGCAGLGAAIAGRALTSQGAGSIAPTVAPAPTAATQISSAPAKSGPLLRFAAVADAGSGDANQRAVGRAMAQHHRTSPFSHVVFSGDNIYDSGEISKIKIAFEDPYAELLQAKVPFRAALGNHDIRTSNGDPQVQYAGYNMQGRYYQYSQGPADFFVLDTNENAAWREQMTWLETGLKASKADWKVVYGHHPIYASGVYGTNPEFVKRFAPLFKQTGVQLFINGHEHHYERSQPIEGTTYLIVGTGGAHLRAIKPSSWTAYGVSRFGFAAVELFGDRLVIEGIGTDGQVFDRGEVLRQA